MNSYLENCKAAELHKIGSVQAFGALMVVDRTTQRIRGVSGNIAAWLGRPKHELLGVPISDLFDAEALAGMPDEEKAVRLVDLNGASLVMTCIPAQQHYLVELKENSARHFYSRAYLDSRFEKFMSSLTGVFDIAACVELLMDEVFDVIDFDRVMLYQFLPDWHGKVIAERTKDNIEGYFGLHFPADDIPKNARELYFLNRRRLIEDVDAEPIRIFADAEDAADLNLSHVEIRAVHPVHIEYLKNMGVVSSYSISIIVDQQLWGIVACHNFSKKIPTFLERQYTEQLANVTSLHMKGIRKFEDEKIRASFSSFLNDLKKQFSASNSSYTLVQNNLHEIRERFSADGVCALISNERLTQGILPQRASMELLLAYLNMAEDTDFVCWETLPAPLATHPDLVVHASGVMAMKLAATNWMILCRREQIETVTWAGEPPDHEHPDLQTMLTPRKSFAAWKQIVRGHADSWSALEQTTARLLQTTLNDAFDYERLNQLANSDPLTELSNRSVFERRLTEVVETADDREFKSAVLMIDLDHFKPVNDNHGHAAGDALLVHVAQRLLAQVREQDLVARIGGDEFAIILHQFDNQEELSNLVQRLLAAVTEPYEIERKLITVGASIGVAVYPDHADNVYDLLKYADNALYKVKRTGRNAYAIFDIQQYSTSLDACRG